MGEVSLCIRKQYYVVLMPAGYQPRIGVWFDEQGAYSLSIEYYDSGKERLSNPYSSILDRYLKEVMQAST